MYVSNDGCLSRFVYAVIRCGVDDEWYNMYLMAGYKRKGFVFKCQAPNVMSFIANTRRCIYVNIGEWAITLLQRRIIRAVCEEVVVILEGTAVFIQTSSNEDRTLYLNCMGKCFGIHICIVR